AARSGRQPSPRRPAEDPAPEVTESLSWRWENAPPAAGDGMKVREVIRLLEADGWRRIRSKSGHRQFKHPTKPGKLTVPGKLSKHLKPGTLRSILRQAGLSSHLDRKRIDHVTAANLGRGTAGTARGVVAR